MRIEFSLRFLWLVVALAGTAALGQGYAQEQSVNPGVNRHYRNPDFEVWVRRFERPGREVYDERHAIVEATGVGPGMVVADIGAGTGLFTRLFSEKVGVRGKVYAVDISAEFVENIERIADERGLGNVQGVVNAPREVNLPAGSVDLAFVCATYHHFEYPHEMLSSIRRALRPGGDLVIIDFRKEKGLSSEWVMGHVREGRSAVIREIEAAGFRFIAEEDLLLRNYFLRFRKPPRKAEPG